jgi:mono/diheme cytochrome c family protein
MMIPSRILGIAQALMIAAVLSNRNMAMAQQPASEPPAGNAENGKTLFVKYGCSQCHGLEGQGAPTSGPRIGPRPIQLAGFIAYVRAPRAQMPPYTTKVVSSQELSDIRAFLDGRPGPAAQTLLPPE